MRTADVLGEAIGGAEGGGLDAALREGVKERVHRGATDGFCAAHDELEVAQIPTRQLLRLRLPASVVCI